MACNDNLTTGCNPCSTSAENTADCETLPSQIENFTKQFFGTVTKTSANGVVDWILPCDLDVGLPNNARGADEGLACYFLRLFSEGIIGLTGPQGATGEDGADGNNAYTVTLASFDQPSLTYPVVTVRTAYNPAIIQNMYVFIAGSGWYQVNSAATDGTLVLTLTKGLSSVTGSITAGKLVVPSGYPGESITGPQGVTGATGPQGDPGESWTEENSQYNTSTGVDWELPGVSAAVDFTTSSPALVLPLTGTYLVTAVVSVQGKAGISTNDVITMKLRNTSSAADLPGSSQSISNVAEDQISQVVINVIYTTDADARTVALYGAVTTGTTAQVLADNTVMTYVRIA